MIALDKQAHFLAGAVIVFTMAAFGYLFLGLAVACVAAVLKEVYDGMHPEEHTKDSLDALATIAGGVYGWLIVSLPLWINK